MHQKVDELIAAYALAAVDASEAEMVRRHLPDCPECQDTLLRMTKVVAVLPLSLEEVEPPADLKARVLAEVGGNARPVNQTSGPPQILRVRFLRRVPGWAPVAAAAVLLAVMFGWNLSLRSPGPAKVQTTIEASLVDTNGHAGVGKVTYLKDQKLALVAFHSLLAPAADRNYELWVIPVGGKPLPSGVFLPDADGTKVLIVNQVIGLGDTIAVTEEALGGTSQPTRSPIISGHF